MSFKIKLADTLVSVPKDYLSKTKHGERQCYRLPNFFDSTEIIWTGWEIAHRTKQGNVYLAPIGRDLQRGEIPQYRIKVPDWESVTGLAASFHRSGHKKPVERSFTLGEIPFWLKYSPGIEVSDTFFEFGRKDGLWKEVVLIPKGTFDFIRPADLVETIELPPAGPPSHFFSKIVGVTHNNPDGFPRQRIIRDCRLYEKLELHSEPENPMDPHAVRICRQNGQQLGYLSTELAEEIQQQSDDGFRFAVFIKNITGGHGNPPIFGVNILIVVAQPGVGEQQVQEYLNSLDLKNL